MIRYKISSFDWNTSAVEIRGRIPSTELFVIIEELKTLKNLKKKSY